MSLYAYKPRFQSLLRPAAALLHRSGVTPNQVTLVACALSIAVGTVLALNADRPGLFALLPVWLLARMALNAIDGLLARDFNQVSVLGAYLNELCDVVSDAALYLPFAFVPGSGLGIVAAIIFLAALSEMAGVLGLVAGASRRYDGPMGKSDRAFVFGALSLLLGLGIAPGPWVSAFLVVVAVLTAITIINRVRLGITERRLGARR